LNHCCSAAKPPGCTPQTSRMIFNFIPDKVLGYRAETDLKLSCL
jgi:hypothetical protein